MASILSLTSKVRVIPLAVCGVSLVLGLFAGLVLSSGTIPVNDKLQHYICFFVFGLSFYWVFDLSKKRTTQLTAATVGTACVVSEFVQAYLTTRTFDIYDIAANLLGLLSSLALNHFYHSRMLRRKRAAKYSAISDHATDLPTEDVMLNDVASESVKMPTDSREAVEALA